jgi:hypothetical protein
MDCIFESLSESSDLRTDFRHVVQLLNFTNHLVAFSKQITDHLDQFFVFPRKLLTRQDCLTYVRAYAV